MAWPREIVCVRSDSCLIIQNKGGGHGEIGYHLALQLVKEKGMVRTIPDAFSIRTLSPDVARQYCIDPFVSRARCAQSVTILHEGPNKGKPPHNSYAALEAAGVNVLWCDSLDAAPECLAKLDGASFSSVVDNWSKSPEQITPYAEAAKAWGVSSYSYVSSAGMYTPPKGDDSAVTEECAVKSSGQRQAEETIAAMGLPCTLAAFLGRCPLPPPPLMAVGGRLTCVRLYRLVLPPAVHLRPVPR